MTSRKYPDQILRHSTRFQGSPFRPSLWMFRFQTSLEHFPWVSLSGSSCQKSEFIQITNDFPEYTSYKFYIHFCCIIYTCIHRHTEKFELKTKDIWGLICRQFDGFTQQFGIFSLAHPWSSSMSRIAHVRPNKTGFFIGICYVYYHA